MYRQERPGAPARHLSACTIAPGWQCAFGPLAGLPAALQAYPVGNPPRPVRHPEPELARQDPRRLRAQGRAADLIALAALYRSSWDQVRTICAVTEEDIENASRIGLAVYAALSVRETPPPAQPRSQTHSRTPETGPPRGPGTHAHHVACPHHGRCSRRWRREPVRQPEHLTRP